MLKEKGTLTFIFWYYSFTIVIIMKDSFLCGKYIQQKGASLVRNTFKYIHIHIFDQLLW